MVFGAGALGDSVMTWPLLRALRRTGHPVTLVARGSHARLAERALGVRGVCEEEAAIWRLWSEGPITAEDRRSWKSAIGDGNVGVIVTFAGDPAGELGRRWAQNARAVSGAQEVWWGGAPGSEARRALWTRARVAELGGVPAESRGDGPAVVHVGAGSREKVWPLEWWRELIAGDERLRGAFVIAGEVEAERMSKSEWMEFRAMGGRWLGTADELLDVLGWRGGAAAGGRGGARLFIGADSGPAHLAAQLGVPTLALFGPTDPGVWSPVGPRVGVARAPDGNMQALTVAQVRASLNVLIEKWPERARAGLPRNL